jgi:hypothetical protein
MRAAPIEINWHSGLPIFASEGFLKAVSDDYGWLGGIDHSGKLRCILPYTIVRKSMVRMGRFRVETIPCGEGLDVEEERSFLNSTVDYLRSAGVDIIIPASSNTVFRTYPEGVDAAPYGSYVIDLCQPEDVLWRNIGRITRQNIRKAQKDGVCIRIGHEHLDVAYALIRDTFERSKLPFMNHESFKRFLLGLGGNGRLMVAEYQGVVHSCTVFAFSQPCAYAIYAGNIPKQHQGAHKLIYWDAITAFQKCGIRRFDFHGARIAPAKGTKQESMNLLKQHFGATLKQGYMWKCSLSPVKSLAYSLAVRFLRGGDIVDHERHKLISSDKVIPRQPEVREQA